jgi:hypothetical protein
LAADCTAKQRKSENRSQRSEVRGQKSEVGSRQSLAPLAPHIAVSLWLTGEVLICIASSLWLDGMVPGELLVNIPDRKFRFAMQHNLFQRF